MTGRLSMVERLARAVIGPREPVQVGDKFTLAELRLVRWEMATPHERADAIWAAKSILRELLEPTDEMLRAGLATEWPALYRTHLRHPDNGPNTAKVTEGQIAAERRRFIAAIGAGIAEHEVGAPE